MKNTVNAGMTVRALLVLGAALASAAAAASCTPGWDVWALDRIANAGAGDTGGAVLRNQGGTLFYQINAANTASFTLRLDKERDIAMKVRAALPETVSNVTVTLYNPESGAPLEAAGTDGFFYVPKSVSSVRVDLSVPSGTETVSGPVTVELGAGDWNRPFDPRVVNLVCARNPLAAAIDAAGAGTEAAPEVITVLAHFMHRGMVTVDGKHIRLTVPPNTDKTVTLDPGQSGDVFVIQGGASLVFAGNGGGVLAVDGNKTALNLANASLVYIEDGTLRLEEGAALRNAQKTSSAPIHAAASGSFRMRGGSITGMEGLEGGAVHLAGGTFTLSGGTISGNTAANHGGGVYMSGISSTFTMNGSAVISGNTAQSSSGNGGGVYNNNGTFIMNGGEIANNTSGHQGGGVENSGTFTMNGGRIRGNQVINTSAIAEGGGVHNGGTFTLKGGEISGNSVSGGGTGQFGGIGGGVSLGQGTFSMEGGMISGNTVTSSIAAALGGGVYYGGGDAFCIMSGGTISGNSVSHSGLSGVGGGVYVNDGMSGLDFRMSGTASIQGNTSTGAGSGVYVREPSFLSMEGEARANNEVYLGSNVEVAVIKITGTLTGAEPVAVISPGNSFAGRRVLNADTPDLILNNYLKFSLHPAVPGVRIGDTGLLVPLP